MKKNTPEPDLDDMIDILTHQVKKAFENGLRLRLDHQSGMPVIDFGWSRDHVTDTPMFTVYVTQQD